jgi:hypothetical protein
MVKSYLTTLDIIEQDKSSERISYILNKNTKTGVFGFIYYHDLNRTPYNVYRAVINSLCDELSIDIFSESFIKNMYETNDLYTMYIMDEIASAFEAFYIKLMDKDVNEFIDEMENEESDITEETSDENEDTSDEKEDTSDEKEESEESDETEEIDDNYETNETLYYVDITQNNAFENLNDRNSRNINYKYIKSNDTNVNYKEKLLEGIIYFTITDDSFKVYYLEY